MSESFINLVLNIIFIKELKMDKKEKSNMKLIKLIFLN